MPFRKFNDSSLVGLIEVASFILIPTPEKARDRAMIETEKEETKVRYHRRFLSSSGEKFHNNKAQRM